MLRSSTTRWLLSIALLAIAVGSSGDAIYMAGKAWLAQHLLNTAWEKSNEGKQPVKPWPWADVHPQALLQIPHLNIRQVVLNDHSGESLAFAPGMVETNGAIVLAGHRDSHFAFLEETNVGDPITWRRAGERAREFRVSSMEVLDTRLQEQIIPPEDALVLITCFPFDALSTGGPLRYVIVAREDAKRRTTSARTDIAARDHRSAGESN